MFLWRNKKNINTFGLKKRLTSAMSLMLISYLEPFNLCCFMRSTHLFHQVAFDNVIGFGLVNMYLKAIKYQYIPCILKVIAIFKTDYFFFFEMGSLMTSSSSARPIQISNFPEACLRTSILSLIRSPYNLYCFHLSLSPKKLCLMSLIWGPTNFYCLLSYLKPKEAPLHWILSGALIVMGFSNTSTIVGHFVSSPRAWGEK